MSRNLIKLILLSTIFLACNNKNDKLIAINVEDLILEFEKDEVFASKKYKGSQVQITGKILAKEFPKDKKPLKNVSRIIFGKADQRGSPFFPGNTIIICSFDKIIVHELNEGEDITVQCYFRKYRNAYGNVKEVFFDKGKIILSPILPNESR